MVKLSKDLHVTTGPAFSFGVDPSPMVVKLRFLADGLENRSVVLQGSSLKKEAKIEDFYFEELFLRYTVKEYE